MSIIEAHSYSSMSKCSKCWSTLSQDRVNNEIYSLNTTNLKILDFSSKSETKKGLNISHWINPCLKWTCSWSSLRCTCSLNQIVVSGRSSFISPSGTLLCYCNWNIWPFRTQLVLLLWSLKCILPENWLHPKGEWAVCAAWLLGFMIPLSAIEWLGDSHSSAATDTKCLHDAAASDVFIHLQHAPSVCDAARAHAPQNEPSWRSTYQDNDVELHRDAFVHRESLKGPSDQRVICIFVRLAELLHPARPQPPGYRVALSRVALGSRQFFCSW